MALTNTAALSELVSKIVASDVQSAAYSTRVLRPLVRNYLVPPGAGSMGVPRFDPVTVSALTEGVAPDSTAMNTSEVVLEPDERGVYVQISKRALHSDPFQDLAPYGDQLGRAMAQDEDAQIMGQLDFTTAVNDTTNDVTLDSLLEGIATLEEKNVPGPYFGVFHPASWAKLRSALTDASAFASVGKLVVEGFGQGFTNAAGFVGAPFGIPCFISTQITTDAESRRQNRLFSREAAAVGYVKDIGIDVDDNVVARALDLMAWYSVDAVKLVDDYGVTIEDNA